MSGSPAGFAKQSFHYQQQQHKMNNNGNNVLPRTTGTTTTTTAASVHTSTGYILTLNTIEQRTIEKPYSVVSELSTSVILSKMFAFSTPDITDNIQPFFVRSEASPRPDEISLATFIPQDDLSELVRLVEHFPGKWNAHLLTHSMW